MCVRLRWQRGTSAGQVLSSVGEAEVNTEHCAQQVVLNNMQKAPRGKLKLEFVHVWDFHKREVQRWRQAVLRYPGGSSWCEQGAANTKHTAPNWLFILVGSFEKAELGFPGCLMFAISIDFSWCWYTLHCFRSVGAAAVPSLLSTTISGLLWVPCPYPAPYLWPYPCIAMPLGQDYLL